MNTKTDKTVVVTGGASGIGKACTSVLAEKGWKVIVTDVDLDAAERVAEAIGGYAMHLDVTDEAAIRATAEQCERRYGPVSALVNSAGILQPPLAPEAFPTDHFDRVMAINFRGTYLTSVAFGTPMAERGHGAIIAIGSMASFRALPLHAYGPSKAAVVQMVQCLAAEWGRSGVRINAISPGYVRTPAMEAMIQKGLRDAHALSDAASMGRMVDPLEIATVAAFLLSDEASAITGVNLPVDCGWLVGAHAHTYGGVPPARNAREAA